MKIIEDYIGMEILVISIIIATQYIILYIGIYFGRISWPGSVETLLIWFDILCSELSTHVGKDMGQNGKIQGITHG